MKELQRYVDYIENLIDDQAFDERAKQNLLKIGLSEGLALSKKIRLQIKARVLELFYKLELEAGEDACKELAKELAIPLEALGCNSILKKYINS